MLRPRIIPSLLLHDKGLVKTINFKSYNYIGDPINVVRIFNEKEVDELAIFDIDATVYEKEPDYALIEKLANQSRMPLCYGGGVKTLEQALKIFSLGIEKISLSSAVIKNPNLITQISNRVGSQSVVITLDVKKNLLGGYEVYTHNGNKATGLDPIKFATELERLGAGEIILNSIDQDGVMKGYDTNLTDKITDVITIPLTILGGAGSLEDIKKIVQRYGVIGISAGSLFVYKGFYKAVLINYPTLAEKNAIFKNILK